MGFDVDDELADFFEGDSPSYSLELDDLHRRDLVFFVTGLTMSAIQSKRMGDSHVAAWKMELAQDVQDQIPDEVTSRMDELNLLIEADGGPKI